MRTTKRICAVLLYFLHMLCIADNEKHVLVEAGQDIGSVRIYDRDLLAVRADD